MLHSPEPWDFDANDPQDTRIYDSNNRKIALDREDKSRIVACVNALAGIPACDLPKVRALWDASQKHPLDFNPPPYQAHKLPSYDLPPAFQPTVIDCLYGRSDPQ